MALSPLVSNQTLSSTKNPHFPRKMTKMAGAVSSYTFYGFLYDKILLYLEIFVKRIMGIFR